MGGRKEPSLSFQQLQSTEIKLHNLFLLLPLPILLIQQKKPPAILLHFSQSWGALNLEENRGPMPWDHKHLCRGMGGIPGTGEQCWGTNWQRSSSPECCQLWVLWRQALQAAGLHSHPALCSGWSWVTATRLTSWTGAPEGSRGSKHTVLQIHDANITRERNARPDLNPCLIFSVSFQRLADEVIPDVLQSQTKEFHCITPHFVSQVPWHEEWGFQGGTEISPK